MRLRKPIRIALLTCGLAGMAVAAAYAQQIWAGGYGGRTPARFPTPASFSGGFNFCRVMFTSDHREKQGWRTDYPGADINFSIRISELTKINVTMTDDSSSEVPEPEAVVVQFTDDALFKCPFIFIQDAGTLRFSGDEVTRLQEYLLKGGFLLVADYHGDYGRQQFDDEIGRVLPPSIYPIRDITPPHDHAMWRAMFPVTQMPQMASINTWRRSGDVVERWNFNGDPPSARAIADQHGRVMVLMVHNTDLPDPWEREGEDKDYFYRFSPEAYSVGINILLYSMTH
jgi:hypothetical protein